MPIRIRKLVGTAVLVAFVVVYALTVMTIAAAKLPGTHWSVQLLYYVFTGLIWVVPAGIIVAWMQRPETPRA